MLQLTADSALADPGDNATLDDTPSADEQTAIDGGNTTDPVPDDAEGPLADARRLATILADEVTAVKKEALLAKAEERYDLPPDRGKETLETGVQRGLITETPDGYTAG